MNERQLDKNAARRLAIIRHVREVTGNVALTCRYYGISRQVFYVWCRRYETEGLARERARGSAKSSQTGMHKPAAGTSAGNRAGAAGLLPGCGAAASPALPAGSLRAGHCRQAGPSRTRRAAVPAVTHLPMTAPREHRTGPSSTHRAVSHRESSPSRAFPAVACSARRCAPALDRELSRQDSAPIRRTGEERRLLQPSRLKI